MNAFENTGRLLIEHQDAPVTALAILLLTPPLILASQVAIALDRWLAAR